MTVVKTKGGVMDLDIDLDEVRAEGERERVRILIEETASAARQEAIAQALSELENEIEKVVRVELAEVITERKLPPRTLSQYRDDLAAFRAGVPRIRWPSHTARHRRRLSQRSWLIWPPRAAT